jgi:pre-mRNA-processing factor 40
MTQSDLLQAFEEFVKDLERDEFQQKKQERRRIERKNRERFVALLKALFDRRVINHRTKWRDLVNGTHEEFKI